MGYGDAVWNPADPSNYSVGNRGVDEINRVIIHTAQGYYSGTQYWFQDPVSNVSTQYVVRSSDGEVAQMVEDKDYAWHVECGGEDPIGIEHEGFIADGDQWYTQEMYEGSARLVAWLSNQYLIPIDRQHILGHDEIGCSDHGDPGALWDWGLYMGLVEQYAARTRGATHISTDAPLSMISGSYKNVTVEISNDGNYSWGKDQITLGTQDPEDHNSEFSSMFWPAANRLGGLTTSNNYPGDNVSFVFPVRAPAVTEASEITETLQLVDVDGNWFGPKIRFTIEILPDPDAPDPQDPEDPQDPQDPKDGQSGGCSVGPDHGLTVACFAFLALFGLRRRRD